MRPPTSARRSSASARTPAAAPEAPPLEAVEFARLLDRLGPFERPPKLALAVSGGPDSLALTLLAAAWVQAQGGHLLALTVDHGLRPESADEASRVAGWLARYGISHRTLRWMGSSGSGLQKRAREARYRLLAEACEHVGILHLLIAHHADDQAETVALRAARGSGPDGLAGMPVVREVHRLRILRPLLDIPKARLVATLQATGQTWINDPSNASPEFTRNRIRMGGIDRPARRADARRAGQRRRLLDREMAGWLARHARVNPAGFVRIDRAAWLTTERRLARRALLQALLTVGGGPYPPREEALARLITALRSPERPPLRTLAGCRILGSSNDLLICREPAAMAPPLELQPGTTVRWDHRFRVQVGCSAPLGLVCRALGERAQAKGPHRLPAAVRPSLPSIWRGNTLLDAPYLGAARQRLPITLRFHPRYPLAGAPFAASGDAFDALLVLDATLS